MSALSNVVTLAGWKGYVATLVVGGAMAAIPLRWYYLAGIASMEAAQSATAVEAQRQAREILERRVAEVGQINERNAKAEWAAYGGMRNAQVQNDGLRADVDAGRQWLHIPASCPASGSGVSNSGAAASLGVGTRAELDPAARSDYFALREGIQQVTAQLAACQSRFR